MSVTTGVVLKLLLRPTVMGVLVLLAACSGQSWTATEADSGSELMIEAADSLEVRLGSNPSTGYGWELVLLPDMLVLQSEAYVEADADLVGAPGTQVFVFEPTGAGAGVLRLEYVRPFDEPPVPERVVEYIVRVDGAAWPPDQTGGPPGTSTATVP